MCTVLMCGSGILRPTCKLWILLIASDRRSKFVCSAFITEGSVEERMVERVAQKLRLDQLVIQQGRQQQSKGDDLLVILMMTPTTTIS